MRRLMTTLATFALLATLAGGSVSANSDRVTEGDVRAHFEAGYQGGTHAPFDQTPPSAWFHAGLRPIEGTDGDGSRQCRQDWHVLLLSWSQGPPYALSRAEAESFFDDLSVKMFLDDDEMLLEKTALKTYKDDGDRFWVYTYGTFYAPGDLRLGSHSFTTEIDYFDFFHIRDGITFEVVDC